MTKGAQREMHILRTQTVGNLMDVLTGDIGERFRALAWEIAELLAEQRRKISMAADAQNSGETT